jgi:murein DD-endopeptidase MepM/ murein hydrolase activator NlpD
MRRLDARLRTFATQSGQSLGLVAMAVMAMAAAPIAMPLGEDPVTASEAGPVAPPVVAVAEPAGPVTREIRFETPLKGYAINSRFGMRRLGGEGAARPHQGVDMAAPTGTGIFAAAEGVVVRTGYQPEGYGRFVEVAHPNGMTTMYAHMSRVDVATGTAVGGGDRLGLVGSTGYSTGPHLHFEVRRGGSPINPARVLDRTFDVVVIEGA